MNDTKKTDANAEAAANAAEIEDVDATQSGARGNVHSEPEKTPDQEAPPPFAH